MDDSSKNSDAHSPSEGFGTRQSSSEEIYSSHPSISTQELESEALIAMSRLLSNNSEPQITTSNLPSKDSIVDRTHSSCISLTENINATRPTLDALTNPQTTHEFHLKNLHKSVTTDMVTHYLRCKGISDTSKVRITNITPRNRVASLISFASFKIDTTDEIATIISNREFWPPQSIIKKYIHRHKQTATFIDKPSTPVANNDHFLMMNRQSLN